MVYGTEPAWQSHTASHDSFKHQPPVKAELELVETRRHAGDVALRIAALHSISPRLHPGAVGPLGDCPPYPRSRVPAFLKIH